MAGPMELTAILDLDEVSALNDIVKSKLSSYLESSQKNFEDISLKYERLKVNSGKNCFIFTIFLNLFSFSYSNVKK